MEKSKKKNKSKILKKIVCVVSCIVVLFTLVISTSSAINVSTSTFASARTAGIPLNAITVKNINGLNATTDTGSLLFTLGDLMQYNSIPLVERYSFVNIPYPFLTVPAQSPNLNNYAWFVNDVGNYEAFVYSTDSNSLEYPTNTQKNIYNIFDCETIDFEFGDIALFDTSKTLNAHNNWWSFSADLVDNADYEIICTFSICYIDSNDNFISTNIGGYYHDYSLEDNPFITSSGELRPNGLKDEIFTINFKTVDKFIKIAGIDANTDKGIYLEDGSVTIMNKNKGQKFCNAGGYSSNLVVDNAREDNLGLWVKQNRLIKTEFIGIGDISFTDWLENAIGGFFDFEIIPNVSLGGLLLLSVSVAVVMLLIRIFRG